MSKTRATITAIGKYVPEKILTNADLEKMVDTSDEWIRTRTGIAERRIGRKDEATSDMATAAFKDMQKRYGTDPLDIDLIITATITPDMYFPSTAALIQHNIGAKNAWGFDLSGACSGFLYALETASGFIKSGQYKKILVVGADKMSSITDYTNRDNCILFGDGASVIIVEPTEDDNIGIVDTMLAMDGIGKDSLYMLGGGSKNPASHETIDKKMHYIYQEGRNVYKFAVKRMADSGFDILQRNSMTGKDIALFIPHQANKRIIDACANRLKLEDHQVMVNIDKYGNTTAATIPLGLADAVDDGRIKRGDIVLMTAFGAGFTWGAIILKWGL